jgi:hypothetical protein
MQIHNEEENRGELKDRHNVIAGLIAHAIENKSFPEDTTEGLRRQVLDMVLAADLGNPATIRRIYPIAARIVEEMRTRRARMVFNPHRPTAAESAEADTAGKGRKRGKGRRRKSAR